MSHRSARIRNESALSAHPAVNFNCKLHFAAESYLRLAARRTRRCWLKGKKRLSRDLAHKKRSDPRRAISKPDREAEAEIKPRSKEENFRRAKEKVGRGDRCRGICETDRVKEGEKGRHQNTGFQEGFR